MKIIYLTWGETPRSYGVFGSQVVTQFFETKKELPDAKFYFISAVPIIHSGITREKHNYFSELKKIKAMLKDISFEWISILATQNLINSSELTFNWMHFGASRKLKRLLLKITPDVIHCRSYHSAWAAIEARRSLNLNYKVVFDGRGLYPEEVALKKGYDSDNSNYRFLKKVEQKLLQQSDISIAVSDPMESYYRNLGAKECKTIYLSANPDKLIKKPRLLKKPINFCYVGALSEETWHKPSSLSKLFTYLKSLFQNSTLTIVTTSDHNALNSYFSNFSEKDILMVSSRSTEELSEYLQTADFGLMSYFEPISANQKKLAEMVLAVKTAEYLCFGLPVIVNKFCGGAAAIIKDYEMGVVYDPFDLTTIDHSVITDLYTNEQTNNRIRKKAIELFSYQTHATQYSSIYQSLSNTKN